MKNIFIVIIIGLINGCNPQNMSNSDNVDYYSQSVDSIFSPSRTKYIHVFENGFSKSNAQTQLIGYMKNKKMTGGGGIFVANGTDLDIQIIWLNDNDLLLKYSEDLDITKQDTIVYFRNDFINVYFQPIRLDDTLKSKLINYEQIGVMDTITAILRGQIIDYITKKPIDNQRISISSGLVMFIDTTDNNGFYKFDMIHAGDYRLHYIQDGYFDFIMDTLHLGTGEIKELNIGLINKN